jgi:thiamine biosynthesis protein ThiI
MDKLEIIQISKKIDTYEISIRPYEDCCTIFTPKAPKTAPDLNEAKKFEEKFDFKTLINDAINNVEVKIIK